MQQTNKKKLNINENLPKDNSLKLFPAPKNKTPQNGGMEIRSGMKKSFLFPKQPHSLWESYSFDTFIDVILNYWKSQHTSGDKMLKYNKPKKGIPTFRSERFSVPGRVDQQ